MIWMQERRNCDRNMQSSSRCKTSSRRECRSASKNPRKIPEMSNRIVLQKALQEGVKASVVMDLGNKLQDEVDKVILE